MHLISLHSCSWYDAALNKDIFTLMQKLVETSRSQNFDIRILGQLTAWLRRINPLFSKCNIPTK